MIVWALDPFTEGEALPSPAVARAAKLVSLLLDKLPEATRLLATTVVNQPLPQELSETEIAERDERLRAAVASRLEQWLESDELDLGRHRERISAPLILSHFGPSTRGPATELAEAAANRGARLIVASTTARNETSRLLLGSFCETLLLTSRVPVLTINPRTKIPTRIGRIVFPTDYSEASFARLRDAIAWAKPFGAKITLLHKFTIPSEAMLDPGMVTPMAIADIGAITNVEHEEKAKVAGDWCQEARRNGLDCDAEFVSGAGGLVDGIRAAVEKHDDAIVVIAVQNHEGLDRVIAHAARALAREASLPILSLPAPD